MGNAMHPEWAPRLRLLLALHNTCGVVAFLCAPVALVTAKGGKMHRQWGKIYFWAMAGIAVSADFVVRATGSLPRDGRGVQPLLRFRSVSNSQLEGLV